MTEAIWFMAMLWIIFLILTLTVKNQPFILGVGGLLGIVLGLGLMTEVSPIVGLIVIFFGFYQMYMAVFKQ